MFQTTDSTFFKIIRAATVISGLVLAACAPMALPNEAGALQPGAAAAVSTGDTPSTAQAEAEFTGTLIAIDGNMWTVNGIRVTITAQTEIKGNPQVGDTVKVHGAPQSDGSVIAREIEVVLASSTTTPVPGTVTPAPTGSATPIPSSTVVVTPNAKIEFFGTVTAINGAEWAVSGFRVLVTAQTEIEGNPQVGSTVKVEGRLQADGSVLAREIKALLPANATPTPIIGNEVEFSGTLTAINGNAYIVNGITVLITANTEVKDALQIGDFVKVHGTAQADGTLIAREIEKDDDNNGEGDDNSGSGNGDDDDDDDHSGHGGGDDDDDDDDDNSGGNSGPGGGRP
ncbi:MAG: DUF5666 domain-containing protein [Anaerolineales bacterium]